VSASMVHCVSARLLISATPLLGAPLYELLSERECFLTSLLLCMTTPPRYCSFNHPPMQLFFI